ncbi:acetyltransferase-like isoleucine patch superfamily enzyme [Okibacterium sp. HSC-33S16]|uniref:acyltransferase n=1 Tax=Okibacterium sp. HSC-33S16 TaxID=2910965 RepID=UPI0027E365E8|nr:acyltransferase [Okibacterium sp. HSC-33S16]MCP2032060.1 acetyltransferase-like isoleucine patch superfamily enzyme [Okibacterium sp. HSC-33S16]
MNGLTALTALQRLRDAVFSWTVGPGFYRFGRGSRILLPFRVARGDKIAIGKDCLIGSNSWFMIPVDDSPTPTIVLGNRVRMNQTQISAVSSVVIDDGVAIARGVYISDHTHGFDQPDVFIRDQPLDRIAPVHIGRGAWIGQNAIIMPGVTIGAGAVVGALSVVRDDVPARTVVAGIPARVIRSLPGSDVVTGSHS